MGLKNPNYQKNPIVPGGGGDDGKHPKGVEITVIIISIVLVIALVGVLHTCIKKKKRSVSTFNNKDFGAMKMGK